MFLANENFPAPSIHLLREAGYRVLSIREETAGISDEQVIRIATDRGLVILTFDRDYGEIIFRLRIELPPAVIFFRYKGVNPEWSGERLLSLLEEQRTFFNCFTIVEENSTRQRMFD